MLIIETTLVIDNKLSQKKLTAYFENYGLSTS